MLRSQLGGRIKVTPSASAPSQITIRHAKYLPPWLIKARLYRGRAGSTFTSYYSILLRLPTAPQRTRQGKVDALAYVYLLCSVELQELQLTASMQGNIKTPILCGKRKSIQVHTASAYNRNALGKSRHRVHLGLRSYFCRENRWNGGSSAHRASLLDQL